MAMRNEEGRDFSEMPGPWGVPILGSMLTLGAAPASKLMDWGEKYYGNVFRYKMLNQTYVVLNGFGPFSPESVKEGLLLNGTNGRTTQLLTERLFQGKGLFFTDFSDAHQRWKTFTARAFGEVMKEMPERVCEQGEKLLLNISLKGFDRGAAIDLKGLMKQRLGSIGLLSFINKEYDEENIRSVVDCVYNPFRSPAMSATLFLFPRLSTVSPFRSYLETHEGLYNSMRERLAKDVKKRASSISEPKDIVSTFISENPDPTDEDIEQLTGLLIDWIFAGTSTCAEQILWVVLFLLKHPDKLKRVKQEIREALGNDQNMTQLYRNQDRVPFLEACIQEAMRLRPIAPKSLPHKTIDDVVVGGFKIPKDVVVIPNIWSVHHDRNLWSPDPGSFRPERHLDEKGSFIKSVNVIPFGLGGRKCAGEQLARANIFIFTAMLLSRYDFDLAPESKDVDVAGDNKSILQTPDFKIVKSPVE